MAYTENHESSPAHLRAVAKRKAELEMFQKDFTNITTNVVPPFTTLTPSAVSPTGDMKLDDPGPQQEPFDHEVEESQQEYPVLHSDSDVGFGSESDCSGVEDVQPVNWTEFLLSHSNPVNQPEIAENAVVPSKAAWAPFRSQEIFNYPIGILVWNNKCYTISLKSILSNELLNPYVTENLDFYPHEVSGSKINRLSQCFKWRDLSPELRAQMVVNKGKHFYIFEPVELDCKYVVVPIFFYMSGEKLHTKCYIPHFRQQLKGNGIYIIIPSDIKFNSPELLSIDIKHFAKTYTEIIYEGGKLLHELCQDVMYEKKDETYSVIRLPNNWREKAQGRIIRHVPITLYADDTSGNKSKQWNKHISFYFTLSGLHPHLTNQEYHMHFLSTSNVATSLELAAPIIPPPRDWSHTITTLHEAWEKVKIKTATKADYYEVVKKKNGIKDNINSVMVELYKKRNQPEEVARIDAMEKVSSHSVFSPILNLADKYHFTASKNVTDMFANNKQIQELFGLHQAPLIQYPALGIAKVPENKQQAVPQHIRDKLQNKVRQVYSNKISQHDLVQSGTFVLVNSTSYGKYVASVNSIWQAIPLDQMKIFLEVTPFHRLEIDRFYQMREYQKTDKSIVVRKKVCEFQIK
ncbi:hypothetical protein PSTT_04786, partial [Puccinia striiformis]